MSRWDRTDQLIAAALQLNGRAPWGAVARALGLPQRTVARRGQRLLSHGLVKVSTYADVSRAPEAHPVIVRLRARPTSAMHVALALSARRDVSSVSLLEGPDHVVALLIPRGISELRQLLMHDLPDIQGVESVDATTVLRFFRSGWDWRLDAIPDDLREQAVAELGRGQDGEEGWAELEPTDAPLVELLETDGRATATGIAAALGRPTHAVRRRIDTLLSQGALHVRTEVEPAIFGLNVEAMVWLHVPAPRIDEVASAIIQQSAVRFCAAVTGTAQLVMNVLVADEDALYRFLSEQIGAMPHATVAEASIVVAPVRRGPMQMRDLQDDIAGAASA